MKRLLILSISALLLLTGCPAEMWIPIETVPRQAVAWERVQYLEAPPDRPYTVVGIITPEAGAYDTEAQAVRAMKKEAAKHGANAIFIESKDATSGWSWRGTKGGSFKEWEFRAKAIAYK
jgi:hypothetical protein